MKEAGSGYSRLGNLHWLYHIFHTCDDISIHSLNWKLVQKDHVALL